MNLSDRYAEQGYLSPVDIVDAGEAAIHRRRLERAEARAGSMHYLTKVHTLLTSPLELASDPRVLDVVEQILGPDILVYNVTYIIKEARSPSHVTWHQDLTYWGLDSDAQVSMWLALSDASEASGCMRVIPGSHIAGRLEHEVNETDHDNVLYRGQSVRGVDESAAVVCDLRPGQASFHHGWLLHQSGPNQSGDRRIGLNVQYIAPHVRQLKQPGYSAWLVRGEDRHGHYAEEILARTDLDPAALERHRAQQRVHRETVATD